MSWFNNNSSKKDVAMVETVTSTASLGQGKSLFGIKIWTWSLGSVIPSGDGKQKPTTINRLKRHAVARKSSSFFPRYGHYCGPNWSSGKDGGSLVWDQRPIDWLDHCCYCHDIGYDTHDQAEMLKADMAFLECLESNKHVGTRGDAHVAFFYKTMCITGLKSILIPYRSYLVKMQYRQNLLDFGWILSNLSQRS
ncbi:hypothetical protein HA466_0133140 [Hirschfeldia incana]|nr:hypothetical protein HA466_0133140 [Hirschfeldia incana]